MENIEEVETTAEEIAEKEAEKLRRIRAEADEAYSQASNEMETFQVALSTITTIIETFAYKFECFQNSSEQLLSGFFEAEKVLMPSRNRQMVFFRHWRDYQN